jgi:hypothetical protein
MARRRNREGQARVLRAVLLAGDSGLTEADLDTRCEGLADGQIGAAIESLIASGLLDRTEARLHPSGPALHFNRLRPV